MKNRKLKRKLKINTIIPFLFLTFFLFACSNRPSYVLSEKKMEKVLYDIYLAEAEIISYNFSSDSARKQELLNSVLKKHKISEAVLDTSLVWYSGNLEKYLKINNNLNKRFTEAMDKLKPEEGTLMKKNVIVEGSGFVLPVEKENFLLRISDLPNKTYTFKTDTILDRYGGRYELQFNILGVSALLNPVVTLCVQCVDTAFVKRDTISSNGFFSSSVDIQDKQAKAVYGSIYFPKVHSRMGIFIRDFILFHAFNSLPPDQQAPSARSVSRPVPPRPVTQPQSVSRDTKPLSVQPAK